MPQLFRFQLGIGEGTNCKKPLTYICIVSHLIRQSQRVVSVSDQVEFCSLVTQVVHLPWVPEGFTQTENGSDLWSMTESKLFLASISFTTTLQANSAVRALCNHIHNYSLCSGKQLFMCHRDDTHTHWVPKSDFWGLST